MNGQLPKPDMFESVGRVIFNDKDGKPIEPELALEASDSGVVLGSLQAEFPGIGATIRFRFLGLYFVGAELIQLRQGQSVVLEIDSKRFFLSLQKPQNLGNCRYLGIKVDKDKWKHLENIVRSVKAGIIP
ncbi:TPA: hypothetical protein EYP66_16465 [Candidatus Poribacteria bacterium]|nr:hypothetical protein [Candidatus Poribacteria bacterium]